MKFNILIILIVISIKLNGQNSIAEIVIDRTIMIELNNGNYGSGLFYQDRVNTYLVTARHVLMNNIKDASGKTINYALKDKVGKISYYSGDTETSLAKGLVINFEALLKKGYLKYSLTSDILVCKIGITDTIGYTKVIYDRFNVTKLNNTSKINNYRPESTSSFEESILGKDVFIFGYPKTLGLKNNNQYDFNRPILRKGVIAGKYANNKTIVIDCPSFGGNSGGPVIQIFKKDFVTEGKLIGIVVSFIPLVETWNNPRYNITNIEFVNSGYSVVEPIEKINELIKQIK